MAKMLVLARLISFFAVFRYLHRGQTMQGVQWDRFDDFRNLHAGGFSCALSGAGRLAHELELFWQITIS